MPCNILFYNGKLKYDESEQTFFELITIVALWKILSIITNITYINRKKSVTVYYKRLNVKLKILILFSYLMTEKEA